MVPGAIANLVGVISPYQDRKMRSRSMSSQSERRQASFQDDDTATPFDRAYLQREGAGLSGERTFEGTVPCAMPSRSRRGHSPRGSCPSATTLARSSSSKYARG